MNSHTATAVLDAPREEVFAYLSDVRNLPTWATEFAQELRLEGEDFKVVTPLGEVYFEIHADRDTGIIDMLAGASQEGMGLFPTRVVGLPDGRSAYSFTLFQAPGMRDEDFERQCRSLERELENVRRRFAP